MIGIGLILIILGLLFHGWSLLITIGIVLLVLNFVPLGGRRYRVW
jgi:membrane-bound ClpP family serine protease